MKNYISYLYKWFQIVSHADNYLDIWVNNKIYNEDKVKYEYKGSLEKLRKLRFGIKGLVIPFDIGKEEYLNISKNY